MKIYVGRWDLLPEEWEGINGLYEATKEEIVEELSREIDAYAETHESEDNRIGVYEPAEFEAEFNEDLDGSFNTKTYWIKIF